MEIVTDPHSSNEELRAEIVQTFGADGTTWMLASHGVDWSTEQRAVAEFLVSRIRSNTTLALLGTAKRRMLLPPLPGGGASLPNRLRILAGGSIQAAPAPTGDPVLDVLNGLAIDAYGELLLEGGVGGLAPISAFVASLGNDATKAALRADPDLPFSTTGDDTEGFGVLLSTGSGSTVNVWSFAAAAIGAAFEAIAIEGDELTIDRLLSQLPRTLETARQALTGRSAIATCAVSLTGARLPETVEIDLGWGKLRPLAPGRQPLSVSESFEDRCVSRVQPNGQTVTIQNAGDILLVARLPFTAERRDLSSDDLGVSWEVTTQVALQALVEQVRLAFVLCTWDERPPVLLPVWQRLSEPVSGTGGLGWSDPRHVAPSRTPTQLTERQCDEWRQWILRLDNIPSRLGAAPSRVLRAFNEPRNSADALIDAVIVWEALFGTRSEVTFRVTASMARLLKSDADERTALQKRAAKIYDLRSRLVHGEEVGTETVGKASTEALGLAIEVMRELLLNRPDLLPLKSAQRSERLLLE